MSALWLWLMACRQPAPGPALTFEGALASLVDRDAVRTTTGTTWGRSSADPDGEADRGRYLRTERHGGREEHVLVDERGPGVMVRLWSANPERGGTLRIRLDGAETPWLEAPMADLLAGKGPVPPPLAATAGRGHVLLLPVPYAERLLVTIDRSTGKGLYWEASGRRVPAASPGPDALEGPELARVAAALAAPTDPTPSTLALPPGPGALVSLRVQVPPDRLADVRLLAEADGQQVIDVPLGALVGLGPRAAPVSTWWASATADGELVSRWPMPYRERLELRFEVAGEPVALEAQAVTRPGDAGPLVLHGAARDETLRTRPAPTFSLARVDGPGVLVAETLWVDNPVEAWWGQGDELLWVDGDLVLRGTGTEDHFGAAWCSHAPFSALLSAQASADAPESDEACLHAAGHAVYHRQRLLDAVPFERSLRLDLEVVHRADTTVRYRGAAFWYAPLR